VGKLDGPTVCAPVGAGVGGISEGKSVGANQGKDDLTLLLELLGLALPPLPLLLELLELALPPPLAPSWLLELALPPPLPSSPPFELALPLFPPLPTS
jgi:hypothetical protein